MRQVLILVAVACGLAACGEREQVIQPVSEKRYQGKPDGRAWESAPMSAEWRGGNWKQGDRTSWEEQIKNRQLAQHEHKRIYQ